jgi:chorismate mutase/prephenate dehydrogenase
MANDEKTSPRPLPLLRALIDSVDREILGLLAKRMAVVAEIAEYKRANRVGVRDPGREREVIDDRRARAERLGLSPSVVESVFRLLMLASRDRQHELRAEVPISPEPRTVAVIGGKGKMGALMADLFADLGHAVMVCDLGTELSLADAAQADVVVVSVPIEHTVEVIRQVGPLMREDALLMDVTSLKQAPLEAMLASTRASVVGTHPMFGPKVHSLEGQRVVICEGRGEAWLAWVEAQLKARGLVLTRATAEQHDRVMAQVQVLTHFQTQVVGLALSRLGIPLEETLGYTSPVYRMELLMTGRHFAQNPELYGAIEMLNPRTAEVVETFQQAAREVAQVVTGKERQGFRALFDEVRRYFGGFTELALEQSSYLIDRLVERS